MIRRLGTLLLTGLAAGLLALMGSTRVAGQGQTSCAAPALGGPDAWLPATAAPTTSYDKPKSHGEQGGDCPFYQAAWQTFLYVATPGSDGRPAFTSFPNIESTFGEAFLPATAQVRTQKSALLSLLPRARKGPNEDFSPNAGIEQAGLRQILVDQAGNPVFYSVHFNDEMARFFRDKGLTTAAGIRGAPADLTFPRGVVELKAAWRIVDSASPPSDYITVKAMVPALSIVNGAVKIDANATPREVTVALLALHVVFVMEGHPEFIWSTFEHVDASGRLNNAPAAPNNPASTPGASVIDATQDYALYRKGTAAQDGNQQIEDAGVAAAFDVKTQTFGTAARSSVFRAFPASKSLDAVEDGDVTALNDDIARQFKATTLASNDKRGNYKLVGAVWMENPARDFKTNIRIVNADGVSPDDPLAMVAGEDRLSSTSMESFTQTSDFHCFKCHDTRHVTEVAPFPPLDAKQINVSHITSMYLRNSGK